MSNEEQILGRVLFVDDEMNILKSIRRELFNAPFEVIIANGGEEGLEILEDEDDIDIVVSDLRMPEMDGFEFLGSVREKYPSIDRVILSGFVDEETILKAITKNIANTYLTKPWDNESLENSLTHMLENRKRLLNENLNSIIGKIEKLPTLPQIYNEIMDAISKDKSFKYIAQIVSRDVSLSTKILQVANSAFYGFKPTTSLVRAIMVLGYMTLRDVVLTFSITDQMNWTEGQIMELDYISNHSLITNRYMKPIYKEISGAELPDEFVSVGITHDVGKIIILQYFPEHYKNVAEEKKNSPEKDYYQIELDLGYNEHTHTEIGAYFLKRWNLPLANCNCAMYHHNPKLVDEKYKLLLNSIFVSDKLSTFIHDNPTSTNCEVCDYFDCYIPRNKINEICDNIRRDLNECFNI